MAAKLMTMKELQNRVAAQDRFILRLDEQMASAIRLLDRLSMDRDLIAEKVPAHVAIRALKSLAERGLLSNEDALHLYHILGRHLTNLP